MRIRIEKNNARAWQSLFEIFQAFVQKFRLYCKPRLYQNDIGFGQVPIIQQI